MKREEEKDNAWRNMDKLYDWHGEDASHWSAFESGFDAAWDAMLGELRIISQLLVLATACPQAIDPIVMAHARVIRLIGNDAATNQSTSTEK
jgi:hypothetical protein